MYILFSTVLFSIVFSLEIMASELLQCLTLSDS